MAWWGWLLVVSLLLTGCARAGGEKQHPPPPLSAPPGLSPMTAAQSREFMPVVSQYFAYRKQAVLAGSPEVLWEAFPALKAGMDRQSGVNIESDVVARYRSLAVTDGEVRLEHYAPLQVVVRGETAVVLINGVELYRRQGGGDSGGQLQLLLYLVRRDGAWTVARTDETTLAEYHDALR